MSSKNKKALLPYNLFNLNAFKLHGLKKEPHKLKDLINRIVTDYQKEIKEGREHKFDLKEHLAK